MWRGPQHPIPGNLIRTIQHAGGYVFGGYDPTGVMLAVSIGLLSTQGLHSHITGVAPTGQRRGLGFALKQHKRQWALERDFTTVTWTFDPLVRRNAVFNLHALGAHVGAYLPDHYGAMDDGVNAGDESDRLELRWDLLSPRALAAAEGRLPLLESDLPRAVINGASGLPVTQAVEGLPRRVQLPADIEALRRGDPAAGRAVPDVLRDPDLAGGAAAARDG